MNMTEDKSMEAEVTICCPTYKQARLIDEAMRGFLSQQTNFHFDILVFDDASPDDTPAVMKKYTNPDSESYATRQNEKCRLKYVRAEKNRMSEAGVQYMFRDLYPLIETKYIAMCDADDYWCDPQKLQRQYDYMEAHPDMGACYAKTKRFDDATKRFLSGSQGAPCSTFESLLEECTITWQTFFIRNSVIKDYTEEVKPHILHRDWPVQDYPLHLYAYRYGIYFEDRDMAVFRHLSGSVTHKNTPPKMLPYAKGILSIVDYYGQYTDTRTVVKCKAKYLSYFMVIMLVGDKNARHNVLSYLSLFKEAGRYVDYAFLLLSVPFLWSPFLIRSIWFVKKKLFPVRWRAY